MISMQYSITLPADYDMIVIDRRIAEKGPLFDGFRHLGFKAFLSARKGELGSRDNFYAPFYLWEDTEGLSNFVCGLGFATLGADFGRPSINTWVVWHEAAGKMLGTAGYASRETLPIAPSADLAALRAAETAASVRAVGNGRALAAVTGFDPTQWTIVRFRLWQEPPQGLPSDTQIYRVGHLALSGRFTA